MLYSSHHKTEGPLLTSISEQPRSTAGRSSTSHAPSKHTEKTQSWNPRSQGKFKNEHVGYRRRCKKHTIGVNLEQSVRDDVESLASSQTVPTYMAPTESAKFRSRLGGDSKRERMSCLTECLLRKGLLGLLLMLDQGARLPPLLMLILSLEYA